MMLLFF